MVASDGGGSSGDGGIWCIWCIWWYIFFDTAPKYPLMSQHVTTHTPPDIFDVQT